MSSPDTDRFWDQQLGNFKGFFVQELYCLHLFPKEDGQYYSLFGNDEGDSAWLVPVKADGEEAKRVRVLRVGAADQETRNNVIPQVFPFDYRVTIPRRWYDPGHERERRRELTKAGRDFAKWINQAFIDVLTCSLTDDRRLSCEGGTLGECLAEAVDNLEGSEFEFNAFLFPKKLRGRLLQRDIVKENDEKHGSHYVGHTKTGQLAFWSEELPDDTALLFDGTKGLILKQDPRFYFGQYHGFPNVELYGKFPLNLIVFNTDCIVALEGIGGALSSQRGTANVSSAPPEGPVFVDQQRLDELRAIESKDFDLARLIRMCEESNRCYDQECYHAVAMLTRAIVDHVPPIFGYKDFTQFANNYGGAPAFQKCMKQLDTTSRQIANLRLHAQVRRKELLPTQVEVNSSKELDLLLSEIILKLS